MRASDFPGAAWRKSSHSGSQADDCIELASTDRAVAVRDSKDPDGPVLTIAPDTWNAFVRTLKAWDA
ncbi:DUF397 domain-containing protein [Actinomadura chokoriensis]|uniref:DUF397 domain-containing protein n=1 Tax=Actinomadura chokoriensis TaxID=454156 RepID=A0ABV4QXB8_9ACTN